MNLPSSMADFLPCDRLLQRPILSTKGAFAGLCNRLKARLHRRFLSRQFDVIFVVLKLQLQNRTCKPDAIFSANSRRDIAGFRTCLKLVATLARQKLHRVAATKIACVNGPL